MTEEEWLTSRNHWELLRLVGPQLSDRKLRLLQVAYCRRMWDLIPDERWRDAVRVAERYADKKASDKMRLAALDRMRDSARTLDVSALSAAGAANHKTMERRNYVKYGGAALFVGETARRSARDPARGEEAYTLAYRNENDAEAHLVREVFGNPFRPVAADPSWRTSTVVALAQQMYESRDFAPMPVLADALQDAGCDNEEVLAHCRGPGPHVRGCWVVDLLLGKE